MTVWQTQAMLPAKICTAMLFMGMQVNDDHITCITQHSKRCSHVSNHNWYRPAWHKALLHNDCKGRFWQKNLFSHACQRYRLAQLVHGRVRVCVKLQCRGPTDHCAIASVTLHAAFLEDIQSDSWQKCQRWWKGKVIMPQELEKIVHSHVMHQVLSEVDQCICSLLPPLLCSWGIFLAYADIPLTITVPQLGHWKSRPRSRSSSIPGYLFLFFFCMSSVSRATDLEKAPVLSLVWRAFWPFLSIESAESFNKLRQLAQMPPCKGHPAQPL